MRDQNKLTFYVGYNREDENSDKFDHEVIKAASVLCGGCTSINGAGWWMQDGAEHKTVFSGKLESEHVLIVELTCETSKTVAVYESMKNSISAWAIHLGIDTQWVHVTRQMVLGMHFDCVDHAHNMPGNLYRDIVSPGTRGAH